MSKIEIAIQHDRDGFYGADENREQPEAEQRYCNMVSAEILKLYPDAKITHEWGQYYNAKVIVNMDDNWDDDDKRNSDIRETVEQIEENIYGRDGSFWQS